MVANNTMRDELLAWLNDHSRVVKPKANHRSLTLIDSASFAATQYRREWLVRNILVAGQPAIIAGAKKSLKTSLALDLALSLGLGDRFLNRFEVLGSHRVAVFSGESGEAVLQETARRICHAKRRDLRAANVHWSFTLPRLSNKSDLKRLTRLFREHRIQVAIIDPLYLCLLDDNKIDAPQNLYAMGPLLKRIAEACLNAGATPILVHHTRKSGKSRSGLVDLDDMAFAGVQEWARQWMLIGRREKYVAGTGNHELSLNVGGSAGFSGSWAVRVNEGVVREDFSGRGWQVTVEPYQEARARDAAATQERDLRIPLLAELRRVHPNGMTLSQLRGLPGLRHLSQRFLLTLVQDGVVEPCDVMQPAGNAGTRPYPGVRMVMPRE